MTQNLSTTAQERIEVAEVADPALMAAFSAFYDCTAQVEQQDAALFRQLDRALVDYTEAIRRVAWLDGWQCGRNPDLLTMAAPTKDGAQ